MRARSPYMLLICVPFALAAALAAAWGDSPGAASPPVAGDPIDVRTIAEVESRTQLSGHDSVKLIPADRVVPGDRVLYTLEVRNTGRAALKTPTVVHPVPEHMRYLDDSAVGPGVEVTYSVDGGLHFDRAANLKVPIAGGEVRAAVAADFTHIRWQFKNQLDANSVAFVRFRAVVK